MEEKTKGLVEKGSFISVWFWFGSDRIFFERWREQFRRNYLYEFVLKKITHKTIANAGNLHIMVFQPVNVIITWNVIGPIKIQFSTRNELK